MTEFLYRTVELIENMILFQPVQQEYVRRI